MFLHWFCRLHLSWAFFSNLFLQIKSLKLSYNANVWDGTNSYTRKKENQVKLQLKNILKWKRTCSKLKCCFKQNTMFFLRFIKSGIFKRILQYQYIQCQNLSILIEKQHECLCKCKAFPQIDLFTLSKMVTDRFLI